jgi:hypothetical protein
MAKSVATEVKVFDPLVDGNNPEYIEQMLNVGARMNAQNDRNPVPAFVPEKFRNAENPLEAMAKSYAELEKKLAGGAPAAPDPANPHQNQAVTPPDPAKPNDVKSLLTASGVDYDLLTTELLEHGNLTEESYAELADAGFPRPLVEQYIAGQKAIVSSVENEVYAEVGGKTAYSNLVNWATDNLSDPEIEAFNRVTSSGDRNQISLAVSSLQAKFRAGAPPNLVHGARTGGATTGGGFESVEQLREAMSDPRYETDGAYVRSVEVKLANSNLKWG